MKQFVQSSVEIKNAINSIVLDGAIDENLRKDLLEIVGNNTSPVEIAVYGMEYLYTNSDKLNDNANEVMGAIAQFVNANNLFANGQGEASRAYNIYQLEKKREGDTDFDTTATLPCKLKNYKDMSQGEVPFAPTITNVTPTSSAASTKNESLKVTGINLDQLTNVTIGGVISKFIALDATSAMIVAPGADSAGDAPIIVTNEGGSSAPAVFAYT